MRKVSAGLTVALCSFLLFPVCGKSATLPAFADFTLAIRANDLTALQKLASSPEAANVPGKLKATPLHYAAIYGSPEAIRILLNAGADPKATNGSAATPLIYAAWNLEKTRLLVENGAGSQLCREGRHYAAHGRCLGPWKHRDCALPHRKGADVRTSPPNSTGALYFAAL